MDGRAKGEGKGTSSAGQKVAAIRWRGARRVIISIARPREGREDEERDSERERERGELIGLRFLLGRAGRGKMARGPRRRLAAPSGRNLVFHVAATGSDNLFRRGARVCKKRTLPLVMADWRTPKGRRRRSGRDDAVMPDSAPFMRKRDFRESNFSSRSGVRDVARYESQRRPRLVRTNQGRLPPESPRRRKNIVSRNIIELL